MHTQERISAPFGVETEAALWKVVLLCNVPLINEERMFTEMRRKVSVDLIQSLQSQWSKLLFKPDFKGAPCKNQNQNDKPDRKD